uniref:N-acetyltransferase domain-containing protein n=1 Tax=uncultured Armatimonadetes bacterium TaxID=157466 RepID=A0A6J4HQY5_9BACT|nr:hypothetical protein AVDCRST_MAG63-991 [uncultured Armatimonadetes bacterium]
MYATNEGLRLYERAGFQRYGVEDRRMFLSLKSARVILSTPT